MLHPRPELRLHRAPLHAAGHALACAGLLALAACGSSPQGQDAAKQVTLAPPAVVSEATGPCDQHHQEAAIAAAEDAIRRVRGSVALRRPEAHFISYRSHPQLPGHPLDPPTCGWCVSFWIDTSAPAQNATPSQAPWLAGGTVEGGTPPPTIYHPEPHGGRDLVQNETVEQAAQMNLERNRLGPSGVGPNAKPQPAMPPPLDPSRGPGGMANSGLVKAPQAMPMNKPDPQHAMPPPPLAERPSQVGVFVEIDGKTDLM